MNDVADVALHFRGVAEPGGAEQWIAADAPKGPRDWNSGGTYRQRNARPLEYDRDLEFRLNSWSYDWPRYTEPFYFGRAAHGMTLHLDVRPSVLARRRDPLQPVQIQAS